MNKLLNNLFHWIFLILIGFFIISLVIFFLPIILLVIILALLFGRKTLHTQFTRVRNVGFRYTSGAKQNTTPQNDNTVYDAEYTVVDSKEIDPK